MDVNARFVMVLDNEIREFESFEEATCFFEEIDKTVHVVVYMKNGSMNQLFFAR
jgi:hypothetical protein